MTSQVPVRSYVDVVTLVAHRALEGTVVGIEFEQMGVGLGVGEIVEGHHLHVPVETVLLIDGAESEAADAAETVDADPGSHGWDSLLRARR